MRKPSIRLVLAVVLLFASVVAAQERPVFAFYYGWYANPSYNGEWLHWQDYDHKPPVDLSTAYYPKLGAYSSSDPAVIDQHMRWIAGANINVLIYSWWGRHDITDRNVRAVMDAAAEYNLKISFLIEPYSNRTISSICDDIEYLIRHYGSHRAFFRMSRITLASNNPAPRPLFFIYDPAYSDAELLRLMRLIRGGGNDSIVLLHSTDAGLLTRTQADGIFGYEAVERVYDFYKGIAETVRNMNGIFIPCVSPGFNMRKTLGDGSALFRKRLPGKNYDRWWQAVIAADAEAVAIISFNEWHEGTQIEPAIRVRVNGRTYLSYDGAYKRRGRAAQTSFLRRTARWIELYQGPR